MGALRGTTRAIAFIKIGFLARILSPFEFGLFGIASLVLAFLEILTETGINAFLVQEESDIKEYINSAWIVSLVRGFLIAFLILILAIPVSTFFNSPESIRLLFLISTVPFLRGFINPAVVNFQKKLQFNKEFNFRLTIFTFDAIVTIFLAILLKSAESLVWGMIAGSLLEIILSWLLVRPLPRFNIESVKVKKVFQRGKWITLAGIFDYLFHNIDDALVGRLINTTSLGLYQIAYKISTLPITEGGEVVSKVVFPVYTRIYGDRERLRTAYFKVLGSITLVTIPFGLFLIKSIAHVNSDFFVIISGNKMYKLLQRGKANLELKGNPFDDRHSIMDIETWKGTAVGVDISINQTQEFNNLLRAIHKFYSHEVKGQKKEHYKKPKFIS